METQCKQILSHLKRGLTITALQALKKFGCMRLAARIKDLLDAGWDIVKTMIKVNGKRVARYFLRTKK